MTTLGYWDFLGAAGLSMVCAGEPAAKTGKGPETIVADASSTIRRLRCVIVMDCLIRPPSLLISPVQTPPLKQGGPDGSSADPGPRAGYRLLQDVNHGSLCSGCRPCRYPPGWVRRRQ